MTDIGELVNVVVSVDEAWKCPFDHFPRTHDKVNVLPPPETANNADKLSTNLEAESLHVVNISVQLSSMGVLHQEVIQFTAHHLIPGNETWPPSKNQLYKWVDKREGKIKGDVGYDVNGAFNGVDLPGHTAASQWGDPTFEGDYANAAMAADSQKRQFHDRHAAYSDFAVACLNKIAVKLEARTPNFSCGDKNCAAGNSEPYDPPYGLKVRLQGVAARLAARLTGEPKGWQVPIMTSRFALMYKERWMTQADARKELKKSDFKYT